MRIKSAYLEGFLGILEGTSRNDITLDFEPGHLAGLQRYMLFGRNGSGKSTTINALTPFPSQGDDRSIIITPNRPGRKIITFQNGAREVKCDIRWSSKGKTSCFMYLDGSTDPLDLTAKGNIGEYLKAVDQELGVTPEFLKIGRVGSRVSGFLDLGPAQRKNYIGRFMPEVEEWSVMYKNISKRVSNMKNELRGLQVELDRIEARDELENSMARAHSDLSRLREELRRCDTVIGTAQGALDEMKPLRETIIGRIEGVNPASEEFNPIASAIQQAKQEADRATNRITRLITERPKLEGFTDIEVATAKAAELSTSIATMTGELTILRESRSAARGRLDAAIRAENTARASIARSANSTSSLEKLVVQRDTLQAKVAALSDTVSGMQAVPDDIQFDAVKKASDAIMSLKSDVADLINAFPNAEMMQLVTDQGLDTSDLRALAAAQVSTVRELRTRIDTLKARTVTMEAQSSFYSRLKSMHCNDARCPFERHVSQFTNITQEVEGKKDEVRTLEERINVAEALSQDYISTGAAVASVNSVYTRIKSYRPVLEAAGVWSHIANIREFYILLSQNSLDIENTLSVNSLLFRVAAHRDLKEETGNLESVQERIVNLEALRDAKVELDAILENAIQVRTQLEVEMTEVETRASSGERTVSTQEQALSLIQQLIDCHNAVETANARVNSLENASLELDAMRTRWEQAKADAANANNSRVSIVLSIQQADQTMAGAQLRLSRRDEFEERMASMQGRLSRAEAVAEACHPARGAPIEFLRDFLDSTRDTVNELLDVAMRGEFRIGFSLTDSEFRIPVAKGSGRTIPDVTEASEGQLALAKTVLSLALVKQTVQVQGGYNVICFDEIDGMLDRERNRERFAEIVERLSTELGLEQLLMISHNDNFAAAPAGIILFPGHSMPVNDESFLSNKLIIADFS